MYLKRLSLKNYRNISSLDMEFSKGLNLILGENAQGKTKIRAFTRVFYGGSSRERGGWITDFKAGFLR